MDKDSFDNLVKRKIDNVVKISFYRKMKINVLIYDIQKSIIETINSKNLKDEFINIEITLSEEDYKKYFGEEDIKDAGINYFMNKCLENNITCNFHHVKYNTQIFDSHYSLKVKYNNPNFKRLTL